MFFPFSEPGAKKQNIFSILDWVRRHRFKLSKLFYHEEKNILSFARANNDQKAGFNSLTNLFVP